VLSGLIRWWRLGTPGRSRPEVSPPTRVTPSVGRPEALNAQPPHPKRDANEPISYRDWPPNYEAGLRRWFAKKRWKLAGREWFDLADREFHQGHLPEEVYAVAAAGLGALLGISGPAWMAPPDWPAPTPKGPERTEFRNTAPPREESTPPSRTQSPVHSTQVHPSWDSDDENASESLSQSRHLSGLSPAEFEAHVRDLFRRAGWRAELTPSGPDDGVDLYVTSPNGRRGIVQCKHYAGSIGAPPIRELMGACFQQRCDRGFIVTSSRFTPKALEAIVASQGRIVAITGQDLERCQGFGGAAFSDLLDPSV
jgi:HJR/Mrr/RecB family endonuclease